MHEELTTGKPPPKALRKTSELRRLPASRALGSSIPTAIGAHDAHAQNTQARGLLCWGSVLPA